MSIEVILSRILLVFQLGVLVWSVVICVKAHRTRKEIDRMIDEMRGFEDDC